MAEAAVLPPVVLLHGCGGSPEQAFERTSWIAALHASGRTPLALCLPGHGRAHVSHDPATYADMARDLLAQWPEGTCDVIGFSLGAKLALDIAARWPDRVRRMVLGGIGDNAFAPETVGEAAASALIEGPGPATPPGVQAFLATWDPALNDPQAVAAVLRRPANPQFDPDKLAAVRAPTVVVNGADDFVMTLGSRLVETLGAPLHVLPGVGHFDLTEQAQFRTIAIDHLTSSAPEGSPQ